MKDIIFRQARRAGSAKPKPPESIRRKIQNESLGRKNADNMSPQKCHGFQAKQKKNGLERHAVWHEHPQRGTKRMLPHSGRTAIARQKDSFYKAKEQLPHCNTACITAQNRGSQGLSAAFQLHKSGKSAIPR